MSVVHFATELSGGAGSFVKNLHLAMQVLGLPSLILTRERNDLIDVITVKPITRIAGSLRARWLTALGKLGLIDNSYALFGIEKSPVGLRDIQHAIGSQKPTAFIFYWISYFVDFETILQLQQAYPNIPFVFVCTDEAFLTGGCHYSHGCAGYQKSCNNCPATSLARLKNRIEQGFLQRQALIAAINPIVVYPTTNIQKMGTKSAAFGNIRSTIIPLGVISKKESNFVKNSLYLARANKTDKNEKMTLLIRSSSEHRKGCDLFASALKIMSEEIPDLKTRLHVISIGDKALLHAQIDKYVEHTAMGYVKREDLMSIYNNVDAFIVTSREDGGPLMTNECVALGIFVISTPIGVAKDLIREKQNGLITRDISSTAISESLISLLSDYQTTGAKIADVPTIQMLMASLTFEGYIESMMGLLKLESSFTIQS